MKLSQSVIIFVAGLCIFVSCSNRDRIVIGSKNFSEQVILGELIAQHLEDQLGLEIDRRLNLGGTFICHEGIIAGQLDIYVEYTGTALVGILEEIPLNDSDLALSRVREIYRDRFGVVWAEPLGFNNTFAMLVRGDDARDLNLRTISDVVEYTPNWTAGFGYEFVQRQDGYSGLIDTYGLRFQNPFREMELGLINQALADGEVDLIVGNSTDGLIDFLDLFMLEDDLQYFPPYDAVPIVREETLERHPEIREALRLLGGLISEGDMRQMNYRVDNDRDNVGTVVSEFLASKGF